VNAVSRAFAAARAENRAALVIYLTFGDPDVATSMEIVKAVFEAGADVVELGVPFSDPNADGPVIERAMGRALSGGATLAGLLEAMTGLREDGCNGPVVVFGYYNPIFVMGVDSFAERASAAGVDAALTVDLPLGELTELSDSLTVKDIGTVPLLAPTSTEKRILAASAVEAPFIYYISMTGITGSKLAGGDGLAERVAAIRDQVDAPVAVGFGIKTAADAARMAQIADGVVVGSAVVQRIEEAGAQGAAELVRELRAAMPRSG
jgi:tryptophan synthase alpha chain